MEGCKKDRKGMSNQDKISELPEDLIMQILSLLPTKVAIATIVLSKRWQLLWKKLQRLDLNFVPSRFTATEKLETLELNYLVLEDVPSSVCMKNLRTLHLQSVQFQDKELVFKLLSGCLNLENLLAMNLDIAINTTVTIAIPSLQRLTIHDSKNINDEYVINAPSLKYLKISGFKTFKLCLIENLPELEEAHISHVSNDFIKSIMGYFTSAKRLFLELPFSRITKFPNSSIFYQLTHLELKVYYQDKWDLLTLMLDSSPKLQVLKLITVFGDGAKWNQPNKIPECLLFHLETFIWENFRDREGEIKIVRYILGNTNHLKKASIFTKAIDSIERVAMVKDLNSVIMASNLSCQLQVEKIESVSIFDSPFCST